MVRYLIGIVLGSAVTFGLFFIMQALVSSDQALLEDASDFRLTEFVRLEQEQEVQTKQRKPEPPPPPDQPPPPAPKATLDNADVSIGVDIGGVGNSIDVNVGGAGGFSADGEYLPIVKVAPVYPRRALSRGIEGYVVVEFTVTKSGAVKDPVVVEAEPSGIFDRAAINAALKFKYKPKVVNGEPIDVAGVQNRIVFELQD
jgi:protein TonB